MSSALLLVTLATLPEVLRILAPRSPRVDDFVWAVLARVVGVRAGASDGVLSGTLSWVSAVMLEWKPSKSTEGRKSNEASS